jgi:hypothetical protein
MKEREKTERWCLGYKVPVTITIEREKDVVWRRAANPKQIMFYAPAGIEKRDGTVSALDPRKNKGPYEQPRGLFLDGAVINRDWEPIKKVVTKNGIDVTKYIKMSFGPGM